MRCGEVGQDLSQICQHLYWNHMLSFEEWPARGDLFQVIGA